jgi:DNA repair exonuclease SbcCD ATPase subunit
MRLRRVSVAGFRGFSTPQDLDLDSDAVILVGANGSGKTSFFDALLWALTGKVPRLGEDDKAVVSKYSLTGEARVELVLAKPDDTSIRVVRRYDGAMNLSLEIDGEPSLRGPSAEARLIEELWPDARLAADPWEAMSRALTRGVYLQQDLLREFIEADGDQGRFTVIGEIVGAGRVGELQRQLESGRTAWTRSTTSLSSEVEPMRVRRDSLAQRLSRLSEISAEASTLPEEWQDWVRRASAVLPLEEVSVDAPDAARILDAALKELEALELQEARRIASLNELLRHLISPPHEAQDVEPLRQAVARSAETAAASRARVQTAQEQASAERSRLVALRERAEELRALAQLALRHLDAHCPVCEQEYNIEQTRSRLERVAAGGIGQEPVAPTVDLEQLSADAERDQSLAVEAQRKLREVEQVNAARKEWELVLQRLASDAGLNIQDDLSQRATEVRDTLITRQDTLVGLRRDGEGFALRLARAGEIAQRTELERELETLNADLGQREAELAARNASGELAGAILNALREASSEIVAAELQRIEPLLQRIYATVDPHPAFRAVRFLTRTVRGRGRLWTSIDDQTASVSVEEPASVLSSSQLNVLAVSVFLALNLGIETLPLNVVALDDPLQSLDDVNLLGLVDLLRRIKGRRQIIVSTHDARFGNLLARKLRPISSDERVRMIQLEGWTREGPIVEEEEIPVDPKPLRLVA